MRIQPLILAAGKGTRMRSSRPKVLQELGGQPMLAHVLDGLSGLKNKERAVVVVGYGADQVRSTFGDSVKYVDQTEQLGTGHAVQVALNSLNPDLDDETLVLILYGDVPFVRTSTLEKVTEGAVAGLSLLTVTLDDATGYGRIVREQGRVKGIVEQKDATPEQLALKEVNTGIMAVHAGTLKAWVNQLSNDNAQGEYYLTDIVAMAVEQSVNINVSQPDSSDEIMGANDRRQLSELEAIYRKHRVSELMDSGVTLVDPWRLDVRGALVTGKDVYVDVNAVFEGSVELGDDVHIEPNCYIKDSKIASGTRIRAFSHLEGASVASGAVIGPYARLRQGSMIGQRARIGNFVETKNIQLGDGSKANHLTYLGDSEIGEGVNIGAGTITCNYDGKNKHKTRIEDDVFVGSNSALVAPVTVAEGATIAAGTIVTKDVESSSLAIARQQQRGIANWVRPDQQPAPQDFHPKDSQAENSQPDRKD